MQSIKQLYGNKLGASDGDIGHVDDFYFDDQNWVVRYLVADTGSWLPGRQVFISPHSLGPVVQAGKVLQVNLTRKQIESSPAIERHKPVSRQYEEDYYRHYDWPFYWQGGSIWGKSIFPILEGATTPRPSEQTTAAANSGKGADAHLRSTRAVNGYRLKASDGIVGHVCDFIMDPRSWVVCQLVVKIGHRFSGREIQIPISNVDRIIYEESVVSVNLTAKAIEQSTADDLAPVDAGGPPHSTHPL